MFPNGLPLSRPSVPAADIVEGDVRNILASGLLTNGPYVKQLERTAAEFLGVRHCVAVASCTAGLMLVLRASGLTGDVVLPSFTFAATAHAVAWNGLRPVFADIDERTLTLSAADTRSAVGVRTAAIIATHTYGTPADIERLEAVALETGIHLFFDAAHAFGSSRKGKRVGGFGHAEVFSLTPTKTVVAGEGGIIATNDEVLAERCRIGRDYGNPGDYDCLFVGLNARMSEFHAAMALRSLEDLQERVDRRNQLASLYREALGVVPGVTFPSVSQGDRSTYKDFAVLVDAEEFGMPATELARALAAEGIETRRYYSPPVHSMKAYRYLNGGNRPLPVTELASRDVLTLPFWSDMSPEQLALVARAVERIHGAARETTGRVESR